MKVLHFEVQYVNSLETISRSYFQTRTLVTVEGLVKRNRELEIFFPR